MPRTNVGVPVEQRKIEEELRARYGGMMTKTDYANELGISRPMIDPWVEGLPGFKVGRFYKYRVRDVAKRIYESMGA